MAGFLFVQAVSAATAMAALFSGVVLRRGQAAHGAALTRVFREPRSSRTINLTFAILLIASVDATFFL